MSFYEDDRIRHKNRNPSVPKEPSGSTFTLNVTIDCSLSHMLASLKDAGFDVELLEDGKTINVS